LNRSILYFLGTGVYVVLLFVHLHVSMQDKTTCYFFPISIFRSTIDIYLDPCKPLSDVLVRSVSAGL